MTEQKQFYNVVFVHTAKSGAYEGVVTWTGYPSKEDFEKCRDKVLEDGRQKVLAEGVADELAIRLSCSTPLVVRMRVARFEATDPKTGEVNVEIFAMKMQTALFALSC